MKIGIKESLRGGQAFLRTIPKSIDLLSQCDKRIILAVWGHSEPPPV